MPRAGIKLREVVPCWSVVTLPVVVAAPALHSATGEDTAIVKLPCADRAEGTFRRRSASTGSPTAPTLHATIVGAQAARVILAGADRREAPCRRLCSFVPGPPPALHAAIKPDGAGVVEPGADLRELPITVSALSVFVPAPALDSLAHRDSTGMPPARRYGRELFFARRVDLPLLVPAPALGRSIRSEPASVGAACADSGESPVRRIDLPVVVSTPAHRCPVVCQTAAVPRACAETDRDLRRWYRRRKLSLVLLDWFRVGVVRGHGWVVFLRVLFGGRLGRLGRRFLLARLPARICCSRF